MPVVPAPPLDAMPRMAMLWVPEVSILMPGMKRARFSMSLIPRMSIWDRDIAEMLIGTLLINSARRVAVTTISLNCGAALGAASAGVAPSTVNVARRMIQPEGAGRRDTCIACRRSSMTRTPVVPGTVF